MTKIYIKRTPKENADKISKVIKDIKDEMSEIRRDLKRQGFTIKDYECVDVEDMCGNDAFNRGYYRALESILSDLKQ